ncbi:hypothetical protein V8F44DRAFT_452225, partial [Aspergillus fumigatus]
YCSRCRKSFFFCFRQAAASQRPNRNICHICASHPDYATEDKQDEHPIIGHNMCMSCDDHSYSSHQLAQYKVANHNMHMRCRRYFPRPANRDSHMIIHSGKDILCLGCPSRFSKHSAMLLRLTIGACGSGLDPE